MVLSGRRFLVVGVLAAVYVCGGRSAGGEVENREQRVAEIARNLTDAMNRGDFADTRRDFGKAMREAMSAEQAKEFFSGVKLNYGRIKKLEEPRFTPPNQGIVLARCDEGMLKIKIVLDDESMVGALWINRYVPPKHGTDRHETLLTLPVTGRWFVYWGGDTRKLNHHHGNLSQNYAIDLVAVDAEGKTHRGSGTRNEDYYCWDRPIVAPADGVVTDVVRGVRDNRPGTMNPYMAVGNAVLIRHRQGEVSVLAHFCKGSIRVEAGQKVRRGQVLGLCGNSGNSSEPHLHYHLQDTAVIHLGTGIKCRFSGVAVERDGRTVVSKSCSPVKGEIIRPAWELGPPALATLLLPGDEVQVMPICGGK